MNVLNTGPVLSLSINIMQSVLLKKKEVFCLFKMTSNLLTASTGCNLDSIVNEF